MMSKLSRALDRWIRTDFRQMNTELEEIYFAQEARHLVPEAGSDIRKQLLEDGRTLIKPLLREGSTDQGFESAYNLLGCVGLYMAACRRHELTEPSRETTSPLLEASALAMHISTTLGVSPRFASSHLTTHNPSVDGEYRSFTSLRDERIFLDYNTLGVFAYQRASDALRRILPLGVSHPLAHHLFDEARLALEDVARWNDALFTELDAARFFSCVRPYYKPYRVGPKIYRGANAGDFAGINAIDLLLGVCNADNPAYAQILTDKYLFMLPEEQAMLKDCTRRKNFMTQFLEMARGRQRPETYATNLRAYLAVVDAHGHAAAQHHNRLVEKYIQQPAAKLPAEGLDNLTASGPPLEVLLKSLEQLRDLRLAARRDDVPTRFKDLQKLRTSLAEVAG
jgi:hypothetical protein